MARPQGAPTRWVGAARRSAVSGLLFCAPMLVLFVVFRLVPTLGAVGLSFTDYKLSGDVSFVGLDNYAAFLESEPAMNALRSTLLYAVMYVPLMVVVALGTALLLQQIVWGSGVFRSSLFLPYVTSFVLAGVIWSWIYSLDGPLNAVLARVGLDPVAFLGGSQLTVLGSVAVVAVWKGFGYSMLILLAGLKTIPADLYESAMIDGASAWRRFWSVTLPLLRRPLFFVLVIETIAAFQVFDHVYVMTGGGPARASYTIVYYIYESGFRFFRFGYAAAAGVVLFGLVLAISLVQRRFFREEDA